MMAGTNRIEALKSSFVVFTSVECSSVVEDVFLVAPIHIQSHDSVPEVLVMGRFRLDIYSLDWVPTKVEDALARLLFPLNPNVSLEI